MTTVAQEATYDSVTFGPAPNQFQFTLSDNGASAVTNVSQVLLDGVNVTGSVTTSKVGGLTTGTYTQGPFLTPGTTHKVAVTFQDSEGNTLGGTALKLLVLDYLALSPSLSVPGGSIDLTQPGFRVKPCQTIAGEPNRLWWAEEQLEGLHGPNLVDFVNSVSNVTANGESVYSNSFAGPAFIDFSFNSAGQFPNNFDYNAFGLPATNSPCYTNIPACVDNSTLAFACYLYFPAPGFYYLGVNSDDGFRVSFAKNSHDLLGTFGDILNFDGGRGIANNQNIQAVYVSSPGYYGTRLLYYNGGGGAGVEFYTSQSPLSGNTNYPVLINYTFDPAAVLAYQVSSAAPPYVSFAEPPLQDDSVSSGQNLHYQLTDASTAVVPGSVSVRVNGASQAAHTGVNKVGPTTDIVVTNTAPWLSGSNWVQLAFTDSAGTNYNYGYSFRVALAFATLDVSQATPLGSQDLTQPGFVLQVAQVDPCMPACFFGGPNDCGDGTENDIDSANAMMGGLYYPFFGTNSANFAGSVSNNVWYWNTNMAFNITGYGNIDGFTNLTQIPGLPTVDGATCNTGQRPNDSVSAWFDGYAVFPHSGLYNMVIASDDGFRLTEGIGITRQMLHVSGASVSMDIAAAPSTASNVGGNWQGQIPLVPITAPIQYVDTTGCPCLGTSINLAGKIALIDGNRCNGDGGDGNYNNLVAMCQLQGAIACIVQASPGWGTPERMSGGGQIITIPALHILGFNGLKEWFHTNGPLTATIGADANPVLGEANYGKGANDIPFTINVPQAGVYPLHLTYEQGGGGCALVWYTSQNGTNVLVNDTTNPNSVLVYRARTPAVPTITISRVGSNIRIDYVGHLLSSTDVRGPYSPVLGASTPYIVPAGSPQAQFYRAAQAN